MPETMIIEDPKVLERKERHKQLKRTISTTIGLLLTAIIVLGAGWYLISTVNRRPNAVQVARQAERAARWTKVEQALTITCTAGIVVGAALTLIGAYYGIRWIAALVRQQEEIHAKDGLFPLVVRKTWTWKPWRKIAVPVQAVVMVDANRNAAPIIRLIGHNPTFELPEHIPPDQRAIAHGAQVIQASAAGKQVPSGLAGFLDVLPQMPPALMAPTMPDVEMLGDGHVQTLLDQAGVLEPDRHLPQ